ncbi:transcriptional repressor DicA (plasmid) [Mycobacterium sp. THAF192]|nr:transcriptional repressor DicA [Mycobacterium sp. THAF192]
MANVGPPEAEVESAAQRLGRYMQARRKTLGLTQTQLASRAHVNPVSISSLETGRQGPPRSSTATRLEDALSWKRGAIATILNGGEPDEEDVEPIPPEPVADSKHLGSCIRERRTRLGLTQEQLANKAGVNTVTVSLLENGRQGPPRGGTTQRLEEALHWKSGAVEHILRGGDPAPFADDPPSAIEISVDIAKSILAAVERVKSDLANQPELAATMLGMLTETEGKLTQLVEQGFTREALHVLMDANALHREISDVLAQRDDN